MRDARDRRAREEEEVHPSARALALVGALRTRLPEGRGVRVLRQSVRPSVRVSVAERGVVGGGAREGVGVESREEKKKKKKKKKDRGSIPISLASPSHRPPRPPSSSSWVSQSEIDHRGEPLFHTFA